MKPYNEIDLLIRAGRADAARQSLAQVLRGKIPRADLVTVASLLRRTENYIKAIKLLNGIVYPPEKSIVVATPQEIAEYAANLSYIGATEEANTLLDQVSPLAVPHSLLYRCFALFATWKYEEAVPVLLAFLDVPEVDPYFRRVAKVNLISALIYARSLKKAQNFIDEVTEELQQNENNLLLGLLHEYSAQVALFSNNFYQAHACLEKAKKLTTDPSSFAALMIEKWECLTRLFEQGPTTKELQRLNEIRDSALKQSVWESVRTMDRFEALFRKDEQLLHHVYFGTPFASYRKKILKDYKEPPVLPDSYTWKLGGNTSKHVLDLTNGELIGTKHSLDTGQLMHKMLGLLCSDFYRPFRIAVVHQLLHPGEKFNPVTSIHKVHEIKRRLKNWLGMANIPLEIEISGAACQLKAEGSVHLLLSQNVRSIDKGSQQKEKIQAQFGDSLFSAKEVSTILELSSSSTLRLLQSMVTEGLLSKEGKSVSTRYRVVKSIKKVA